MSVSNAHAKRAIAGKHKASATVIKGIFVKRAAAGTVSAEDGHTAASFGVSVEDIASGTYGKIQRALVVEMKAAAPLERGMAVRSTGSGFANRKSITGELAMDDSLGLDGEITAAVEDNEAITWTSDNMGDLGKYLMIIGMDTDDSTEKKELVGPLVTVGADVDGAILWSGTAASGFVGAVLMSENNAFSPVAAAGTITIRSATTETTLATMVAGAKSMGVLIASKAVAHEGVSAAGEEITAVSDGSSTKFIYYYGISNAGAELIEIEQLNASTPVTCTGKFDVLLYVVMSEVEVAETITFTATNDTTNTTKGYVVSDCRGRSGRVLVDLVAP